MQSDSIIASDPRQHIENGSAGASRPGQVIC